MQIQISNFYVFPDSVSRVFIAGATSQAGDADAGKRIIRGMKETIWNAILTYIKLFEDIFKYLKISSNDLKISSNHLKISSNELKISSNGTICRYL